MLFFATDALGFSPGFLALQRCVAFAGLLVGTAVYARWCRGARFRAVFFWCQLLEAVASLGDVALALRLNARLGVPDAAFAVGSEAVSTVLGRVAMQPFFVVAARLCPPGCEASLYAFFMATHNLGSAASGALGAALLPAFGVARHAYAHLWALLLLRSALMCVPMLLVGPCLRDVEDAGAGEAARPKHVD